MEILSLNHLPGLVVEKIVKVHDYVQIYYSDRVIMNVYNNYQHNSETLSSIENCIVETAEENDQRVLIRFVGGVFLSISLSDDAYNGPEALTLFVEGETPVVWN